MADEEQLRGFGAGVNKRKGGGNPRSSAADGGEGCDRRRPPFCRASEPSLRVQLTAMVVELGRFGNVGQHGRQDRDTGYPGVAAGPAHARRPYASTR